MRKANAFWNRCSVSILALLVLSLTIAAQHSINEGALAPPGKLVDLGGRRLHINCTGKGQPTVVMEAGAGDFSFDWGLVQPQVARFARVCSYDRAGYAWSDPGPTPRTMRQITFELHSGLLKEGIKGPYILVGHSLGGAIVRTYVSQYTKDVVGMVLVDSVHEEGLIGITDRTAKKDKIGVAIDCAYLRGKRFCVLLAADYRISTRGRGSPLPYSWKETNSSAPR